ncbi:MAG: HAMP domain-containing histidine kinase [Rhodocyclales bacterium]|nr:HAMP domain-containing histidine kinase [Rhodocyclales bacterium]
MKIPYQSWGIRTKLIVIFVVIKVLPLVMLALLAWGMARHLGDTLTEQAGRMAESMLRMVRQVGNEATDDAILALDDRARESMERLTTDTARAVASFLYDRDADLLQAAQLEPSEAAYRNFLSQRKRTLYQHGPWKLAEDQKHWEPLHPEPSRVAQAANPQAALPDNARAFSARPPEFLGMPEQRPLFVEMSFVDLQGREQIKITQSDLMPKNLRDISRPEQTFLKAERYWPELKQLKPGEIYVSEVIGAYVGSRVIGPYLPETTQTAGLAFEPEASAYAGTENPVGQRFRAIIRWATPVLRNGQVVGYVTLALDHDHLRQFTDRLSPTQSRYTPIADPISGNYAFMWDHKSRAISHPRDYFIVGFDPATGERVVPWLDEDLYSAWQASGKPANEFLAQVRPFEGQSLKKKSAKAQVKAGTLALDCRYLNFSPQCTGWNQLTEKGGSGSFTIFFSGLWKLTTAAAIPYYTGQYGKTPQGFGFVTIGANLDDFHRPATESARRIALTIADQDKAFQAQRQGLMDSIADNLAYTAGALSVSTLVMVALVIAVAVWMAHFITWRITGMNRGMQRFKNGELNYRLKIKSADEMGELARSFNAMADEVQASFGRSEEARRRAEEANKLKSDFLANVSHELRTPLTGILGYSELLSMDLQNPEQQEFAATIHSSGQHLLDVVNDLLDLAKIEAGRMELKPQPLPLVRSVQEIANTHRPHAEAKGLTLVLELAPDLPETVLADGQRLRQVLNNLLNNAIKFTDNGRVCLDVRHAGDCLRLAVIDTGPGIPHAAQGLIFEKFRQADQFSTRSHGGTGLGLALARELAHLMGGELDLVSEPGQGATFTLTLPLGPLHS